MVDLSAQQLVHGKESKLELIFQHISPFCSKLTGFTPGQENEESIYTCDAPLLLSNILRLNHTPNQNAHFHPLLDRLRWACRRPMGRSTTTPWGGTAASVGRAAASVGRTAAAVGRTGPTSAASAQEQQPAQQTQRPHVPAHGPGLRRQSQLVPRCAVRRETRLRNCMPIPHRSGHFRIERRNRPESGSLVVGQAVEQE